MKENIQKPEEVRLTGAESRPGTGDEAHGKNAIQGAKGKEEQKEGTSEPGDGDVRVVPDFKKPRSIFAGIGKGSGPSRGLQEATLVACVSGTPRDPSGAGLVRHAASPSGDRGVQGWSSANLNHHILLAMANHQ